MKCPKCGSEVYHISTQAVKKCSNVECDFVIDFEHQQRIDKVLEKFESKRYELSSTISLYYEGTNEFLLFNETSGQNIVISLDTVESLLKDFVNKVRGE